MCGIAGMVGQIDERAIRRMTQILRHRGPDDGAIWISPEERVALGHRRLSVIDPSPSGRQPMLSADRQFAIVYNGEIFNYMSLRKQLESKGYSFVTKTDTEVLLNGFIHWGKEVLERIEGQFAFAIWDRRNRTLFCARDRFGIKPFYYTELSGALLFASEAKAIFASGLIQPEADWRQLSRQLSFLWVPHPDTLFRNVRKLEPGYWLEYREGELSKKQYWDPLFRADFLRTVPDTILELRTMIDRSVQEQLASDVPIGMLLSGGIDSTCVLAALGEGNAHVQTLTASYSSADRRGDLFEDDLPYARMAAKRFRAPLKMLQLGADVLPLLEEIVWHLDEPLGDPSVVTNYLLCREAKPHATVLLSGMGADELFGGYPRHVAAMAMDRHPLLFRTAGKLASPVLRRLAFSGGKSSGMLRRAKILADAAPLSSEERFLSFSRYWTPEDLEELTGGSESRMAPEEVASAYHAYFESARTFSPLNRLLYVDMKSFLPCLNLENMDKTSMAHGVEMRVPFLHEPLVALAATIPDGLKIAGRRRKFILKKSFEGIVPDEILARKKTGFSVPVRKWLRVDLREAIADRLRSHALVGKGVIRREAVERILRENAEFRADHALKIWQLFLLDLWIARFIDAPRFEPSAPPEALPFVTDPPGRP